MTDLRKTIVPKSDQINADDLIGTTKTIKITKVSLSAGDQPVVINYEGDEGKPYLPCKSMRRVLVKVWGADGNEYVGRSLTLYCDEKVQWGGQAVGGIRISHMSHIDKEVTMALTASKSSRKPFTVKPLVAAPEAKTLSEKELKSLWNEAVAKGITQEVFTEKFGSLRSLKADSLDEVKAWIAAYEAPVERQPGEDG